MTPETITYIAYTPDLDHPNTGQPVILIQKSDTSCLESKEAEPGSCQRWSAQPAASLSVLTETGDSNGLASYAYPNTSP